MEKFHHILFIVVVLTATFRSNAQDTSFFTNLNGSSVTCYYGTPDNPYKYEGIKANRHEVISEHGYDTHTNGSLSMIPEGEDHVVMLGSSRNSKKGQAVRYNFTVDSDSTILLLKFAVVFYSPGGNQSSENCARFLVKVTYVDEYNNEEIGRYEVTAADLSALNSAPYNIWWMDWTSVGIDLSPYIGTDVEVEFLTNDNNTKYGYAYYTASCINSVLNIEDCGNPITLSAPDGFVSYLWNDGTTGQSDAINVGTSPVNASCTMTSLIGDTLTLNTVLIKNDSTIADSISATVCIDEPYTHQYFSDTIVHTEVGDYQHFSDVVSITDLGGCNSTKVTLYMHVIDQLPDILINDDICKGITYTDNGFNIATDTLEIGVNTIVRNDNPPTGCSQTTILHLDVLPSYDSIALADEICFGEIYNSYGFHAENLPVGDTVLMKDTLTSRGCDSTIFLHLLVNPSWNDITIEGSICYGETYSNYGFEIENDSVGLNIHQKNSPTASGCDSVVTLNLTVNDIYEITLSDTICFGEDYHDHGFDTIGPAYGTLVMQNDFETQKGCDSTVIMNLEVIKPDTLLLNDVMCSTGIYEDNNFYIICDTAGQYYGTLHETSVFGCDSLVFLNLIVSTTYNITIYDTIPLGEGYDIDSLDIHLVNPSVGLHPIIVQHQDIYGCESTVTLYLYVAATYNINISDTTCYGDGYYENGFEIENPEVGLTYDTIILPTMFGFDSVVCLELYVAPTYSITFQDTICFGEEYHGHGFDYYSPEDYEVGMNYGSQALATTLTCDSVVNLRLYVAPTSEKKVLDKICFGEDYHGYGFDIDNPDIGWHYDTMTYQNTFGCDSVVSLALLVSPTYSRDEYASLCVGDGYSQYGIQESDLEFGDNSFTIFFQSSAGCDSIINLHIWYDDILESSGEIEGDTELVVETNMATGKFHYSIDSIPACTEYIWKISNKDWVITPNANRCELLVTTPDTATISVRASNTCSSIYHELNLISKFNDVDETDAINLEIYPNPCSNVVNIEGGNIERVRMLTTTGIMLKEETYGAAGKVTLNLTGIAGSLYLLEVTTSEGRYIRQITIMN